MSFFGWVFLVLAVGAFICFAIDEVAETRFKRWKKEYDEEQQEKFRRLK